MSSRKDGHFIRQPFVSSFIEITPEEVVVDNNLCCHKPDGSP